METVEFLVGLVIVLSFLLVLVESMGKDYERAIKSFENEVEKVRVASILSELSSFGVPFSYHGELPYFSKNELEKAGCTADFIFSGRYEYKSYRRCCK